MNVVRAVLSDGVGLRVGKGVQTRPAPSNGQKLESGHMAALVLFFPLQKPLHPGL